MSNSRSGSDIFVTEINFSLIVNILQRARSESWQISKNEAELIITYQNNLNKLSNDEKINEKISHLQNIYFANSESSNSNYQNIYTKLLNHFYERGIEAIFAKANVKNGDIFNERELEMIETYHLSLQDKTDNEIFYQYGRLCLALANSASTNNEDFFLKLHDHLYNLKTDLLQGIAELICPSAELVRTKNRTSCSPAA